MLCAKPWEQQLCSSSGHAVFLAFIKLCGGVAHLSCEFREVVFVIGNIYHFSVSRRKYPLHLFRVFWSYLTIVSSPVVSTEEVIKLSTHPSIKERFMLHTYSPFASHQLMLTAFPLFHSFVCGHKRELYNPANLFCQRFPAKCGNDTCFPL